jgi:hypothetical protein
MSHRPPAFRRTDLQRAIRSARTADLPLERVEINRDGSFTLVVDNKASVPVATGAGVPVAQHDSPKRKTKPRLGA